MFIPEIGIRLSSYEPLWDKWYTDSFVSGGDTVRVYRLKADVYGRIQYSDLKLVTVMFDNTVLPEVVEKRKQEMIRETENMYLLNGKPHIVQCFDHAAKDIYDDYGCIVGFDFLVRTDSFTSVAEYVKTNGPMREEEIKKLAFHIADGLRSMHEIGMLHRDIRPESICTDNYGGYLLGSIGFSGMDASDGPDAAGRLQFIAPEVWKGQNDRSFTKAADIYSFGLTLYWLLKGGRLPFAPPGATAEEIENSVFSRLEGKPRQPLACQDELLKTVVMKCCAYYPDQRYQKIEEVIAALSGKEYEDPSAAALGAYTAAFAQKREAARTAPETQTVYANVPAPGNYPQTNGCGQAPYGNPPDQGYYPQTNTYAQAPAQEKGSKKSGSKAIIAVIAASVAAVAAAAVLIFALPKDDGSIKADSGDTSSQTQGAPASPTAQVTDAAAGTTGVQAPVSEEAAAAVTAATTAAAAETAPPETTAPVTTTTATATTTTTTTVTTTAPPATTPEQTSVTERTRVENGKVIPNVQSYIATMYVNTQNDNLRMRKGPGYDYPLVFQAGIPKGTQLDVCAEEYDPASGENWAYVTYSGYSGWCTEKYLALSPSSQNTVQPNHTMEGGFLLTVAVNELNFRTGPGQSYASMGKFRKGTKLLLAGYQTDPYTDQWLYISYNGQSGWVMAYTSEKSYVTFD